MSSNLSLIDLIESQSKKYKKIQKNHQMQQISPSFTDFSLNMDTKVLSDCSQMLHQVVSSANSSSSSTSSDSLGSSLKQFQLHNYESFVNEGSHKKNSKPMKTNVGRLGSKQSKNSNEFLPFMSDNTDASSAAATASR